MKLPNILHLLKVDSDRECVWERENVEKLLSLSWNVSVLLAVCRQWLYDFCYTKNSFHCCTQHSPAQSKAWKQQNFRLINTIQTQMTNKWKKFSNRSRRLVYVQECCKYNNTTKMNDIFAENKLGHIEKNEIRDYKWTKQERKRWKDLRKRARKAKEVSEIRKTVR